MSTWFKLDNAAKIYPSAATRRWQSMFRLSVTLTEPVDPALLARAQERALKRFPSFAVRLRRGFFWYYLEHLDGAPPITEDLRNPMGRLTPRENRGFQYRLLYYKNRIALEFFHVVADGTGGMTFLLSLTNEYLRLAHGVDVAPAKYILSMDDAPRPEETEDAFLRYASGAPNNRRETPAYHPRGNAVPLSRILLTAGEVPTAALSAKAKEYGVTVGVFLNAALTLAVHEHQQEERSARRRSQPVKVCTPINLRQFFPSATVRNFSSFINPGIDCRYGVYTFREILQQMQHQMGMRLNEKELRAWMSYNVKAEQNLLVRMVPLAVKKLVLKVVHNLQGDRFSSVTLSNLGLVRLPDDMAAYVDRLDFFLGRATKRRCQMACVSYGGRTFIDFSRTFAEPSIERRFFTMLVRMGIPVKVESNGALVPLVGGSGDSGGADAASAADAAGEAGNPGAASAADNPGTAGTAGNPDAADAAGVQGENSEKSQDGEK